ncbi:hypothetical protein CS063_03920 [Sporanaerobium hydrogeniformans]|uniref:Uncharacterized protein n=1 Tax=Sporanaerobium hydrogeniformans TaxID=3072179 RepID=A0AC61DET0_9FIRM|nr:sodium-dependent transporter [Sporanaerobium hydrogeniformans]PHV71716.1 hypothetical protein CS063_03920 [Sporanaerobium hydrogeniformans]
MHNRDTFASKIGIVAAAAGSAIGLGNIWKFPYMAGKYGGSAFIIIYLLAILLMGFPLICAEFAMGRKARTNAVDTFGVVTSKKAWNIIGVVAVLTVFLISTFYIMITGWVIYYFVTTLTGKLYHIPVGIEVATYFDMVFNTMSSSMWLPLILALIAVCATGFINAMGIQKGVEKYSKLLMPVLFILFLVLIGYSTTLPGFKGAISFLFQPDFSSITPSVIISAIGQAFFSLSLGMGALITYGSYISEKENIRSIGAQVVIADTIIALFSGLLIFPAVFTYNLEPTAGPALIFMSLPQVFLKMPGGQLFSALFFLMIFVAALTSLVSMLEIQITYIEEKTKWSRKKATAVVVAAISLGSALIIGGEGPLSFITITGKSFFDSLDYLTNNITIPLVAVFTAIIVGWVWKKNAFNKELAKGGHEANTVDHFFFFLLKWVIPPTILILMIALLLGVQA